LATAPAARSVFGEPASDAPPSCAVAPEEEPEDEDEPDDDAEEEPDEDPDDELEDEPDDDPDPEDEPDEDAEDEPDDDPDPEDEPDEDAEDEPDEEPDDELEDEPDDDPDPEDEPDEDAEDEPDEKPPGVLAAPEPPSQPCPAASKKNTPSARRASRLIVIRVPCARRRIRAIADARLAPRPPPAARSRTKRAIARLGAHASRNHLPATVVFAPGPRVSVVAVARGPVVGAGQCRARADVGDELVGVDAGVLEIEPGEPKPSLRMRGQIILLAKDRAIRPAEDEILVEEVSEHDDVVRQHRRSQSLFGVADFVLQRSHGAGV